MSQTPWREYATATAYDRFCRAYGRYGDSSRALVAAVHDHVPAAVIDRGLRGLDWAAGTGVTTAAWLAWLHAHECSENAEITALERSLAMAAYHSNGSESDRVQSYVRQTLPPRTAHGYDVVIGNSMWWLLDDPVLALHELTPWLSADALVAWSTPSLYRGVAPSAAEIALSMALDHARRDAAIELLRSTGVDPGGADPDGEDHAPRHLGPLDPVRILTEAGWQVIADSQITRSCSAAEWLAHTLLPPVRPPWLRQLSAARADDFVAGLPAYFTDLADHSQGWHLTIAQKRP